MGRRRGRDVLVCAREGGYFASLGSRHFGRGGELKRSWFIMVRLSVAHRCGMLASGGC